MNNIFLFMAGLVAGFIDSIAGGGGLITLPVLSLALSPGAHAIGTNKIVGTLGAFTALWVYQRSHKIPWKSASGFVFAIGLGALCGSVLLPKLSQETIRWIIVGICPVILFLVLQRQHWADVTRVVRSSPLRIFVSGFFVGIYDGAIGPGGGTLMFLALKFFAGFSLMASLVVSKLANTVSAGTSLVSYAYQGYVHVLEGLLVGAGMTLGAYLGATFASKHASRIIRPVLVVVVVLLVGKLIMDSL